MPVSEAIETFNGTFVSPLRMTSGMSSWKTIIAAAIDTADNSSSDIVDVSSLYITRVRPWVRAMPEGTYMQARLVYPSLITSITTAPVLQFFGAHVSDPTAFIASLKTDNPDTAYFERLVDSDDTVDIILSNAPSSDVVAGSFNYGRSSKRIDTNNNNIIIAGIKTAFVAGAVSSGTLADEQDKAYIEGRVI